MDLTKVATLGRIERIIDGKSEFSKYELKRAGDFFYLIEKNPIKEAMGGNIIMLSFHKEEVIEQVEGNSGVAGDTFDEYPGETFLRFLRFMLFYLDELEASKLYRNYQISRVLNELIGTENITDQISLSLRSDEPEDFVFSMNKKKSIDQLKA
ncbi:hypothetical protein [Cyclobacterium roseum]|uniref:hypothetical protein n=1 Tax=Cyclobacterium roseum TaxID=2666137 RepID=UPI00139167E5|nr:hypothetical protein [Cyclobacterium roseum]